MNNGESQQATQNTDVEVAAVRGSEHLAQQLDWREQQLATIVEHNPTGILLLDGAGRVLLQNPVAAALVGTVDGDGMLFWEVLPLRDEQGQAVALTLPEGDAPVAFQGYLRGHNGDRGRYLQVGITPVHQGAEENLSVVEGYVVNLVDLTAWKETENAKRAFLAGLSHELKTPLALIRGYAENLRYPQIHEDSEMYDEALDVILDETEHLTQMVDQLLLAARLQAGALSLDVHEVSLARLLQRLVEEYKEILPGHDWKLSLPAELPSIPADPNRLRAVFHNLLSNAGKYSDSGSLIEVSAAETETGVRVTVRDEGIGIAQDEQPRLFQRFFRASDRADGTGLGLFMSKAIVEAHGGTISVESEAGVGSSFTVELPGVIQVKERNYHDG